MRVLGAVVLPSTRSWRLSMALSCLDGARCQGILRLVALVAGAVMSSAFFAEIESAGPDVVRCSVAPNHGGALGCADNATGFKTNPFSCASPLGHPRLLCRLGLLMSLGGEPYRRSLRWNFPIVRFAAHDRESDARHLVGERHGDKFEGLPLDKLLGPRPQRVCMGLAMKQHGMRPDDEQFAQVPIAHLGNAPELLLAAGG